MSLYGDVFAALDRAGVRYVVVGGVAVVLRGHARLTADLDLVIDLAAAPALAAVDALLDVGLRPVLPVEPRQFADPVVRRDWVAQRNLQVFSFYDPEDSLREVDLFASHPVPFETLYRRASVLPLGEHQVRVASIPDLIDLKRIAGRPQDLADIAALTALSEGGSGS